MSKVIPFTGLTKLDLPVERVLEEAKQYMTGVVLIGYDNEGCHYFASTFADGGEVLWLLEKCKQTLMEVSSDE